MGEAVNGRSAADAMREARALLCLEQPDAAQLAAAESLLTESLHAADATPEAHALLGLSQFLQAKYVAAKNSLTVACSAANPHDKEWDDLLARATRNSLTRYDLSSPPTEPFERATLLAPPALFIRAPADVKPLPPEPDLLRRIVGAFDAFTGALFGALLALVVWWVGRKGPEKTWALWPNDKSFLFRDLRLVAIRKYMNANTLQDPYAGRLVGDQTAGQRRPEWTERFRTATGAWTTDNPMEGAAGSRFIWQGKDKVHQIRRNRLKDPDLPNPIAVARSILSCEGPRQLAPFLNLLAIGWIQFMLHDWLNHRQLPECDGAIKVELPSDDARRTRYGQRYMFFRKTQPSKVTDEELAFENEVTAWWDGSQIYGSDQATQDNLRRPPSRRHAEPGQDGFLPGGKLYVEADGTLAVNSGTRVIESGFTRNMWVGLELFHTLFVTHHNYLCDEHKKAHPDWSGDQIFNHARLENAATMAKIHTIEWTPAVLPTKELATGMSTNWHGMLETLFKSFESRRPLSLLEPTNAILGGVLGGALNNFGVPQNFSEQFAEVYRLHAGLPDTIEIRSVGSENVDPIETDVTRAAASHDVLQKVGMETVINSFGYQHMPALVHNNYPTFMIDMSTEGSPMFDLGAADVVRARERGVPPYNEFRRQLGMPPIATFEELACDSETIGRLQALYGTDANAVERMDLLVGMHCDMNRPLLGFDNTRFAIFLQAATRRLQTDPFFTEKFNDRYYTKEAMERINGATLKSLLLLHYPGLRDSGLIAVNNAFEPWGTTAASHPGEHPLTASAESYLTGHPNPRA